MTPAPLARHASATLADGPGLPPAARFLQALACADFEALEACLAPDLWFRALLPKAAIERHDAGGAMERLRYWFETPLEKRLTYAEHEGVGTRERLVYRFELRPEWDPEHWYQVEHTGYARARDGQLARLDLICTGFQVLCAADAAG